MRATGSVVDCSASARKNGAHAAALQASPLHSFARAYALTGGEPDIVLMVLQGLSNKDIARSFSISEQTVKDHLKHVYGKVGVHQRTALYAKVVGLDRLHLLIA